MLIPVSFLCTRRWYIDKFGIFHANQTSMCLDPHQKYGWGWYRQTCLSPPVIFLLTVPRRCFFVDPFYHLRFLFAFVILSCLFHAALWSPAGKGLTHWLFCVWCFLVFLSLSHVVSWVRYGTWLYQFLIFAFFLTFISTIYKMDQYSVQILLWHSTFWHFLR